MPYIPLTFPEFILMSLRSYSVDKVNDFYENHLKKDFFDICSINPLFLASLKKTLEDKAIKSSTTENLQQKLLIIAKNIKRDFAN